MSRSPLGSTRRKGPDWAEGRDLGDVPGLQHRRYPLLARLGAGEEGLQLSFAKRITRAKHYLSNSVMWEGMEKSGRFVEEGKTEGFGEKGHNIVG